MKTLVVYYSRSGITRQVAEALARELGADLEEIAEPAKRAGVWGFLKSGREAFMKITPEINPGQRQPSDYDLVIVGTPVWANTMASPVRAWLTAHGSSLGKAAFFCTTASSGGEKAPRDMAALAGKNPLATAYFLEKQVKSGLVAEAVAALCAKLRQPAE